MEHNNLAPAGEAGARELPRKVLVVAPSWVGDLVAAQALLRLLKQRDPTVIIDLLLKSALHPLARRMEEVNCCWDDPFEHGELCLGRRYRLARKLRKEGYAQAYILPNSFKSALIPWFAGIRLRTGWRGELRYGVLNDLRPLHSGRELRSEALRFAALGCELGEIQEISLPIPSLNVDLARQEQCLRRLGLTKSGRPRLIIAPGAEYGVAKRWPPEYFAKIVAAQQSIGWEVWIIGSPKERTIAQVIKQSVASDVVDLTGQTELDEVVDLLALATVVVSNDSGLMHVAAALDRPLVVIYGPTAVEAAPPLSHNRVKTLATQLACRPCRKRVCPLGHHNCMRQINPETVLQAIAEVQGPLI